MQSQIHVFIRKNIIKQLSASIHTKQLENNKLNAEKVERGNAKDNNRELMTLKTNI